MKQQSIKQTASDIPDYWRSFLTTHNEGFFIIEDSRLIYRNPRFNEILKLDGGDLEFAQLIDLLSKTEEKKAVRKIRGLKQNNIFSSITFRLTNRFEEEKSVQLSTEKVELENRKFIIGRLIDTVNELSVENELFASLTILNAVFNAIEDGICVLDSQDYSIISSNKSTEWIFGTTAGDLIGRKIWEFAHDADEFEKKLIRLHAKLLYSGTVHFETEMCGSGGAPFPTLLRLSEVVNDLTNETEALLLVITDITRRVNLDRSLTEVESRYRLLFDKSSDAIFVTDMLSKNIIEANYVAELQTGYARDELIDMPFGALLPPTRLFEEIEKRQQISKSGNLIYEGDILRKDGNEIPVQVNMILTKLAGRSVVISSCRDISKLLELEQERMRIAKLDAVRELAGGIAHEASQPLQALISISDIVNLGTTSDQKIRALVKNIPPLVERLHTLFEQMQGIVRIEKMTYTEESDIVDLEKSTEVEEEKAD